MEWIREMNRFKSFKSFKSIVVKILNTYNE